MSFGKSILKLNETLRLLSGRWMRQSEEATMAVELGGHASAMSQPL